MNPAPAQDPPDLVLRNIPQRFGHQRPRPGGVTGRWRFVQLRQDPSFAGRAVPADGPRTRGILQADQTGAREAHSPFAHAGGPQAFRARNGGRALARRGGQDDPASLRQALLGLG